MPYSLRDHTADVGVEATGSDLDELFAGVANGLTACMCESVPDDGDRFAVEVTAEGLEAALFDYLDQLIYERDVRDVLPVDHEATVTEDPATGEWTVAASARGVPLSAVVAREIKAVTYSEMTVEETDDGWRAYVVFDV
ncbi:archease [Halobium salinum]|uniref:Archease n=1 Tax=Halobium salinum TaxID=1364940 RepID=A0ABD5P9I0_9EURY|nr:archease [Halobium salinum]